jgi:2'-5' RNA ligase
MLLSALKQTIQTALSIPIKEKIFHITLATKRDLRAQVPESALSFKNTFELNIPITEILLMESREEEGRRVYEVKSTYSLTY